MPDPHAELMTAGPCSGGTARAIVELSLFLKGLGYGQPHLQELRPQRRRRRLLKLVRCGDHGQRPQSPLPWPAEETSSRAKDTSAKTRTQRPQHKRSTAAVPLVPSIGVTDLEISGEQKAANRRLMELVADIDDPLRDHFRYSHRLTATQQIVDSLVPSRTR